MKIAFVFKYENNVGGGHFWRCYNLANNLKRKNRKFYFFSNSISNRYLNFLKKAKYKHIAISNNNRKNFKIQLFNKIKKFIERTHTYIRGLCCFTKCISQRYVFN